MSELVEFLLARIGEDEALAREAVDDGSYWLADKTGIDQSADPKFSWTTAYFAQDRRQLGNYHIANWDPARVLAECAAKRELVTEYAERADYDDRGEEPYEWAIGRIVGLGIAARAMASVYADHPDYRQEWMP